jgi:hypothetical protein
MLRSDKDTAMLAGMAINWAQEFGAIPVRSPHDLWAPLTPEQKPEEVEDAAITDTTILPVINQAGPSLLCGLCVPRLCLASLRPALQQFAEPHIRGLQRAASP